MASTDADTLWRVKRAAKSGGCIMLAGLLSVVAGMSGGFGPCGPASTLGAMLFFGGFLSAVLGLLTVIIALVYIAVRDQRTTHS